MEAERLTGERGASLLIALGFLALFGAMIPPLLNLGTTNLLATARLHEQRSVIYAADGATDTALQYLRAHPGCGRQFQVRGNGVGQCPIAPTSGSSTSTFQAAVEGQSMTTTIVGTGSLGQLDRSVTLSTADSAGKARVTATAIIRDSKNVPPAIEPPVDVTSWTYNR